MMPFIRKYDSAGINIWHVRVEGSGLATATSAGVDESGNVYLAGWISGSLGAQSSPSRLPSSSKSYRLAASWQLDSVNNATTSAGRHHDFITTSKHPD